MWCKYFITHIILVAAEVLWHHGSLFYHDAQYSQLGWFTNLLWCDIPLNKSPCVGPLHTWYIYTLCPFSGHEKNTDGSGVGWMISLAGVYYCESQVRKLFLFQVWCQQSEFHWWLPPRVWFFSQPLQYTPTMVCLIYTPLCDSAQLH